MKFEVKILESSCVHEHWSVEVVRLQKEFNKMKTIVRKK